MWYLSQFSMTPFEERYMKVPYEFMEYSYLRFMNNLSFEDIRDDYLFKKSKDKEFEKNKEEMKSQKKQLLDGGWDEEKAENILNTFAKVQLEGKQ